MINLKNKNFSSIAAYPTRLHAVIASNKLIDNGYKSYITKQGYGKMAYANKPDKKVYNNFYYMVQTSLNGYNYLKGGCWYVW